jgi:hypothetical protein
MLNCSIAAGRKRYRKREKDFSWSWRWTDGWRKAVGSGRISRAKGEAEEETEAGHGFPRPQADGCGAFLRRWVNLAGQNVREEHGAAAGCSTRIFW